MSNIKRAEEALARIRASKAEARASGSRPAQCSAGATPRFQKVYLECLDDTGAITRLEPLYAFAEGMERENQDLRLQMVGLRREIEHQKNRVLAWERVASPAAQPNIRS